jgi:hypothetical protein
MWPHHTVTSTVQLLLERHGRWGAAIMFVVMCAFSQGSEVTRSGEGSGGPRGEVSVLRVAETEAEAPKQCGKGSEVGVV